MKKSEFQYQELENMSTLEMLMTVPCDHELFSQVLKYVAIQ